MLVEQAASLGVRNRFESVVRSQLAIDVVQMIPESLSRYFQTARYRRGVAAIGEHLEDATFL